MNGDNGVTVEHFKVLGGGHTWPGNAIGGAGTNYDIDASAEIWKFFSKYDINGLIEPTGLEESANGIYTLELYPNPTNSFINLVGDFSYPINYQVFTMQGMKVMNGLINSS